VEIVWDLINVLREYLKMALDEEDDDVEEKKRQDPSYIHVPRRKLNLSNILSGLLCSF
jgi:hypothetical protein